MKQATEPQKVYLARLRRLRDVVVPHIMSRRQRFHMAAYEHEGTCGTTRCLAGWAGYDEKFNKQGFKLVDGFPVYKNPKLPVGGGAEIEFFGLKRWQWGDLFSSVAYGSTKPTKRELVAAINKIIRSNHGVSK